MNIKIAGFVFIIMLIGLVFSGIIQERYEKKIKERFKEFPENQSKCYSWYLRNMLGKDESECGNPYDLHYCTFASKNTPNL